MLHDSMPFCFLFSPFLIFLLQLLTFYWSCPRFRNSRESITGKGNSYHGVEGNFPLSFLSQISKHFRVHFALKWTSHSDLDITGKNFSYRVQNLSISDANLFWSRVMTSEVLILEPSFAHALLVSMFLNIFVVHNNTIGLRHVSTLDNTFDEGILVG